jgi:dipeptidyl aminopeptidase/acylaminoacyl peptidase
MVGGVTTTAPYGSWESPITAELVAAAGGGPDWVEMASGRVWWAESRPADGGRVALVHAAPGQPPRDALPPGWNVRNRVHEYGGRPFAVVRTGAGTAVVFTHWDDQRLYRLDVDPLPPSSPVPPSSPGPSSPGPSSPGRSSPVPLSPVPLTPVPLTPVPQRPHGLRYAEPVAAAGGADVWCVRETITGDAPTDLRRELVAVPLDGSAAGRPDAVRVLAASHRFMTAPRPSPDGRRAAWIGWDHPAMPWDGTELCVAELGPDGRFGRHRVLAGGPAEAVCQLEWDGPDALLAMTDPDGWWNLHQIAVDGTRRDNLAPVAEELGGPLWRPGVRWFVSLGGGRHAVLRGGRLAVLDERGGLCDVPSELDWWTAPLAADGGRIACVAGGPQRELAVVVADLATPDGTGSGPVTVVELTPQPPDLPAPELLPRPVELMFTEPGGAQVPALVYPPTNPAFQAPDSERPPYLVHVHGGPTSRNTTLLDLEIAFFTSRGIGVVAPDYGGSTGRGRAYRERLREQWGVVDVADCAAVALALAADGVADRDRLAIRGGSAGGWTTVASLTAGTPPDGRPVYRCGAARYPIVDLSTWNEAGAETHDLESRYLDGLIGPLPQTRDRYVERSPFTHLDRLAGPILLLQGLDDQICPPAQAKRLADALAGSGVPHAYLTFEGEQHGFRKAETIAAALLAELSLLGQVLGFAPPGVPRLELTR